MQNRGQKTSRVHFRRLGDDDSNWVTTAVSFFNKIVFAFISQKSDHATRRICKYQLVTFGSPTELNIERTTGDATLEVFPRRRASTCRRAGGLRFTVYESCVMARAGLFAKLISAGIMFSSVFCLFVFLTFCTRKRCIALELLLLRDIARSSKKRTRGHAL